MGYTVPSNYTRKILQSFYAYTYKCKVNPPPQQQE
jgi:hypothetical protein